jgi:L-glyceraldehyde 3-phosphate reductase
MMAEPANDRYERTEYRRCGRSGLLLPPISLGAWETFGGYRDEDIARVCILRAFDLGVTHFDFANNYGRPPGNAELVCGRILQSLPREELVISSKAGFPMWPGPYGTGGSRKYLITSCEQSLRRMGLDCFDIFYSHYPDPATPIEETMGALASLVQQGKALYVGVSSYTGEQYHAAVRAAATLGPPVTVHQAYYNLLGRTIETDLLPRTEKAGTGVVAFCPLASGLLTDRYLDGDVPPDSRAAIWPGRWVRSHSPEQRRHILNGLDELAKSREQTLAQMALAWTLRLPGVTSAVVGASRVEQLEENLAALDHLDFSATDLVRIDQLTA